MATARVEEYKGIVLSRIPQKERDAMVRCLGPSGFFSFYSRGALKVGGANNFLTQELSLGAFNLMVSSTGALTLRDGKIEALLSPEGNLEAMLVAQLCIEATLRILSEEEGEQAYPSLETSLKALLEHGDPFSIAMMYLARVLRFSGYGIEVGHCVVCGAKKGIVSVDFTHGGFLCQDCLPLSTEGPLSVDELKVFHHAFAYGGFELSKVTYPKGAKEASLRRLLRYCEETSGARLRSLEPIFHAY